MISLRYQKNDLIENTYYAQIIKNRSKAYISDINKKCNDYLSMSFKDVVCASPQRIYELQKNLKSRGDFRKIQNKFKCIHSTGKQNDYLVDTLYKKMPIEAKQIVYKQAGLRVCPYCNRSFIEKLKVNTRKGVKKIVGTWQLDHFYSKVKFPMFAVSLYNLIPVCGSCNYIKGDADFKINPYLMDKTQEITFEYDILGIDYLNDESQLKVKIKSSSNKALHDVNCLKLEELYNGHRDIVQEIIKKTRYYGPEYMMNILNEMDTLFEDKDELYRMLYGGYRNPDEFGKRPLSKFIKEIYEETVKNTEGFDYFSD